MTESPDPFSFLHDGRNVEKMTAAVNHKDSQTIYSEVFTSSQVFRNI